MLYQYRRRLHGQLEDQDTQLHKQPHASFVQVELVPNSANLSDVCRHQDYWQRLRRHHSTHFEQSSNDHHKSDFDGSTRRLRNTCAYCSCDIQLEDHNGCRSDNQDRWIYRPTWQLEHSVCTCAVRKPVHHLEPALVDQDQPTCWYQLRIQVHQGRKQRYRDVRVRC